MGLKFSVSFGTYTLSEIDVALFSIANDGSTKVNLCADNASSPGTVLETLNVVADPTGTKYFLNSVLHPTLTIGNYFLTFTPGNASAGSAWCQNGDGVQGPMIFSTDGGTTFTIRPPEGGSLACPPPRAGSQALGSPERPIGNDLEHSDIARAVYVAAAAKLARVN